MNTRFAMATHVMLYLAFSHEHQSATNSESIAQKIGTHPVVIRRLIGALRKAELVRTQLGAGGGAQLTRCPDKISLLDIYTAIEPPAEQDLFALGNLSQEAHCHTVGASIQATLEAVLGEAERALQQQLAQTTLAALIERMKKQWPGGCAEQASHSQAPPVETRQMQANKPV
jgi:Rrf2 family protein